MYVIKMFSTPINLADRGDFRSFFALVCAAVQSLQMNPIKIVPTLQEILPLHRGYFTSSEIGLHRVFIYDKKVYKIFDNSDDELKSLAPNVEAIETICKGYLPELNLVNLTSDKRLQRLEYNYLEGSHEPKNVMQFLPILQDLQKLHTNDLFIAIYGLKI